MLTIGHFVNWVPCEVFAVAFLAFVLGTRMRIGTRIGWMVVLAICCAKFWLFGAFGGNRYNPVLPAWVILILNLMFSWAAGIATMGLVWWHRRTRVWAVPVLAAVLAAIGNWNGLCLPEVREVRLAYPNLPQELEGYRIVQVSDLHASTATRTVASCRESPPSFPAPATASSVDSTRSAASFSMSRRVAANVHGCQFVSLSLRN